MRGLQKNPSRREPKEVRVTMRKLLAVAALCLAALLSVAAATPSGQPGVQGVLSISQADAAVGRGGGGGEGGGGSALQVGQKTASLLKGIFTPLLFIVTAILIGVSVIERRAGLAVMVIILAVVVGAFLLAPGQVKETFISIYNYVL